MDKYITTIIKKIDLLRRDLKKAFIYFEKQMMHKELRELSEVMQIIEKERLKLSNIAVIRQLSNDVRVKERFEQALGAESGTFISSIVSAVNANSKLQECDPNSIWSAGIVAAGLKLPVNQNLGLAYMVPYKDKNKGMIASFQIGFKGFIQLAIRSGQYKNIGVSEVYADEIKEYNPISGEFCLNNTTEWELRKNKNIDDIVGYYAFFKLNNGFEKSLYMTKQEVTAHGKKYSQSFKKDYGLWVDSFDDMAKKTVLKQLLSKWGILSIEMQKAVESDQKVYITEDGEYIDNPQHEDKSIVEDPFIEVVANET